MAAGLANCVASGLDLHQGALLLALSASGIEWAQGALTATRESSVIDFIASLSGLSVGLAAALVLNGICGGRGRVVIAG